MIHDEAVVQTLIQHVYAVQTTLSDAVTVPIGHLQRAPIRALNFGRPKIDLERAVSALAEI